MRGLGATDDSGFGRVGEPTDRRTRAELLDETLEILTGLWTGEPFGYEGRHYRFPPMAFRPTPVQRPRIPIWVVGGWPSTRSVGRAARYDGVLPQPLRGREYDPAFVEEVVAWIAGRRSVEGYDVVIEGTTPGDDAEAARAKVAPWEQAGATWWIESDWESPWESVRRRIEAGPPR